MYLPLCHPTRACLKNPSKEDVNLTPGRQFISLSVAYLAKRIHHQLQSSRRNWNRRDRITSISRIIGCCCCSCRLDNRQTDRQTVREARQASQTGIRIAFDGDYLIECEFEFVILGEIHLYHLFTRRTRNVLTGDEQAAR